jgi:hypothetical protein
LIYSKTNLNKKIDKEIELNYRIILSSIIFGSTIAGSSIASNKPFPDEENVSSTLVVKPLDQILEEAISLNSVVASSFTEDDLINNKAATVQKVMQNLHVGKLLNVTIADKVHDFTVDSLQGGVILQDKKTGKLQEIRSFKWQHGKAQIDHAVKVDENNLSINFVTGDKPSLHFQTNYDGTQADLTLILKETASEKE